MNNLIVEMLQSPDYLERIKKKLPPAFEIVQQQASGPEVGVLREAVLIGMFMAFLEKGKVTPNTSAVEADIDCYVGDAPLSIKTVTGTNMGGVRIKWTSDQEKAREFIASFSPECDLLVVRIVWEAEGRISYIPVEAQQAVFSRLGRSEYLDYRQGTNTRGVNLSRQALTAIENNRQSVVLRLQWYKSAQPRPESKYDRWVSYWREE